MDKNNWMNFCRNNIHYFIGLMGGYIAVSVVLFCFPTLIRRRKKYNSQILEKAIKGQKIIKVAHRGGPRLTTENTIEAFNKSIKVSDMLQMDICQTKDKILVVHHDRNLQRTCGLDQQIENINYNNLPKFKNYIQLDFSNRRTIHSNNEKIPTLEQVFKMFPQVLMNIELKTPTDTSIKELCRLLKQYHRQEITIIGIRNRKYQKKLTQDPNLLIFCQEFKIVSLYLSYFFGLLPFMNIRQNSLQIPLFTQQFYQQKLNKSNNPNKVKFFFTMIKIINWLSGPLIWHLKRRGIMTLFWVCNTPLDYENALKKNACGIMTDDPFKLQDFIRSHHQKQM